MTGIPPRAQRIIDKFMNEILEEMRLNDSRHVPLFFGFHEFLQGLAPQLPPETRSA